MPRKTSSTNYANRIELQQHCPMQTAMEQIGGRWKVLILWYVHLGANRYSLLLQSLPTISRKMLTQQLGELVHDGLLSRDASIPGVVVYGLAAPALQLLPLLIELNTWGRVRQAALPILEPTEIAYR